MANALNYEKMRRRQAGSAESSGPVTQRHMTFRQRDLIVNLCNELDEPYPGLGPSTSRAEASELIRTLKERKG